MRGQASLEFMVVVVFTLFFVLAFYGGIFGRQLNAQDSQVQGRLEVVCGDFAEKINNAYYYGTGFSQNATIYSNIYGFAYNITVYNHTLLCEGGRYGSIKKTATNNITNGTHYTPFIVPAREVKIENIGDRVVIS